MSSESEVFEAISVKELILNTIRGGNAAREIVFKDGTDLVFQTSTGTQIGTADAQKLAFHGATTIVRAVLATGSTNDQIITALQNLGLVKQS